MPDVEVELLRRRQDGSLAAWLLNDDGSEPVRDADALVKLEALRALLDGTLDVFVQNLPSVQPVSGTVAVSNFPATQPVSGTVAVSNFPSTMSTTALTNAELRATPVPVSGSVAVSAVGGMVEVQNDAGNPLTVSGTVTATPTGTQTVAGTVAVSNFPASQPVTGPLTDAQLRATAVPVSGTVTATPTGTQAVSGPLTNAELRATAVPVSMASTPALTDAQLRAAPLFVDSADNRVSATLTTAANTATTGTTSTSAVLVVPADGVSGFTAQVISVAGAWVGSVTTEYSVDNGATWTPTAWRQTVTGSSENTLDNTEMVNTGTYTGGLLRGSAAGATHYRVRQGSVTAGSVLVHLVTHLGTGAVFSNTVLDTRSQLQYLCSAAGRRVGFNSTTDVVSSSTAEQLFAVFRNPAGSGVDLTLYKIEFGGSVAGKVRRYRGGTFTAGTGQTPRDNVNRAGGTATSVGQLYPGTRGLILNTSATGGTLAKVSYISASSDDVDPVDGTLTLRPGEQSYWTVQNVGGTGDAAFDIIWAQSAAAV